MTNLDITSRGYAADDKLKDYVEDKIGGIEKYLPRGVRGDLRVSVTFLDDPNGREDNRFVCEAIVSVPGERLVAKEGTLNMYASVDIVEAKLKAQARAYKAKHVSEPRRERMLSRLIGRTSEADQVESVNS